jgi:ParB family chromosome partitioning protein
MARKRGLGKGLDALIPTGPGGPADREGVQQVLIDDIVPNPRQPRTDFDSEQLEDLAASIREHGVLQPLIVAADEEGEGFQLIVGERRLQAARMAGLDTVPVVVRQVDEEQLLILALIENLQRSDLNPLEAASGYQQLADEFDLSHEAIASTVGKSRTAVSNTLRLLKLSSSVKEALREGRISEGHARALLSLSTAQAQASALQTVLNRDLSVRQTEELVRRLSGERPRKKKVPKGSPEDTAIEENLRHALGTRVSLNRSKRGGSIIIRFYSDEELEALLELLIDTAS